MERRLAIVVITWNSARYLRRCAEGVASQSLAPAEIVVVDNASSDGSAELAAALLPSATVIRNSTNTGFAAAANQGIAATRAELVLLLNPDVFLGSRYCEESAAALDRAGRQFGAATGRLLRGDGDAIAPTPVVDSLGIRMTRSGRHLDIGAGEPDRGAGPSDVEVFGVSGAAAVYRRAFLDDVSVFGQAFDEDFFTYREDADLAWRGQLLGWKALCAQAATAWHVRRVTPEVRASLPPEVNMHSVKNRFLLRLKNEGSGLAVRNALFEIPRDLVVAGAALTIERSSLPAFTWLWKNRASILAKRSEIQRRRRVEDRDLARWFD
ncbi:MAG: glycosyltransferase [Thermoanaerobaculia bacterium]|nr:glycosyltransferase [Thermoanaerobaculia bacterium]